MISLVALACLSYNRSIETPRSAIMLLDNCSVNGAPAGALPRQIRTGAGGDLLELSNGTARLEIWDDRAELVGLVTLVGHTSLSFKPAVSLFPVGVTLNFGTIDCESDASECEITVNTDSCTVVTTGTHFQLTRGTASVDISVFSGKVKVTPNGGKAVELQGDEMGKVGKSTSGGTGVNRSTLNSRDKQAHYAGPAHF